MLSDFRKKKLSHVFEIFDADKKGFLAQSDYERLAHRFAQSRNFATDSPEHARLKAKYVTWWSIGVKALGADPATHRMTLDQWLTTRDIILSDPKAYAMTVQSLVDLFFEEADTNGDGKISLEEYKEFFAVYGLDRAEAEAAFRVLDVDSDGFLSHDDVTSHVKDFNYSEDPSAKGNWLFGGL